MLGLASTIFWFDENTPLEFDTNLVKKSTGHTIEWAGCYWQLQWFKREQYCFFTWFFLKNKLKKLSVGEFQKIRDEEHLVDIWDCITRKMSHAASFMSDKAEAMRQKAAKIEDQAEDLLNQLSTLENGIPSSWEYYRHRKDGRIFRTKSGVTQRQCDSGNWVNHTDGSQSGTAFVENNCEPVPSIFCTSNA